MIRTTSQKDENKIIRIATASGLFESSQTDELASMLREFHRSQNSSEIWLVDEHEDGVFSVAYLAPEKMTEGTWNLYLIAVPPEHQRKGFGKKMLLEVVKKLTGRGERVLLVETSGTDDFDYVRGFYRKNGFEEEARIRDFYSAGVDKIIFRRAL